MEEILRDYFDRFICEYGTDDVDRYVGIFFGIVVFIILFPILIVTAPMWYPIHLLKKWLYD